MSYDMGHPAYDPAGGSRVATPARGGRPAHRVNGRSGGTATASRARRAVGLNGYGDYMPHSESQTEHDYGMAGYGLGFSFNPLNVIKTIAKPVISLVPGGSTILQGASILGGLKGSNPKDQDRINDALAKMNRALAGDATAYLQLQQGTGQIPGYGSATAVGKEAFKRALAYVDSQRAAPKPSGFLTAPVNVNPIPSLAVPMVQQVQNAGLTLATQQTAGGGTQVVATNPSTGAVVSQPLPIPVSSVPAGAPSLPANAVQANAPASAVAATPPTDTSSGIFSIFDKLSQQLNAATAASQNAQSQAAVSAATGGGAPPASAPTSDTTPPVTPPSDNSGKGVSPILIIGVAAGLGVLFLSGHGGRR